jgi:hypothetical protein
MIPEWTVVGFSGHRNLPDPKIAADGIRDVLDQLAANYSPLAAVSSVASGADTLFVEDIVQRKLPYLLVLPFDKVRFQQDFSPDCWQRVLPLIKAATHTEEVAGEDSDDRAYTETGVNIVDMADVMVVVWDSKPAAGPGGTGDVVNYVRKLGKPLLIVDANTGQVCKERLEQLPVRSLSSDWMENPRETVEKHFLELDQKATPHAPKTRQLVFRIVLYQLIASAIGFVALSFDSYIHGISHQVIAAMEVIFLALAFALSFQHRKKHSEWMRSRIEAEICRSFLVMWSMRRRASRTSALATSSTKSMQPPRAL